MPVLHSLSDRFQIIAPSHPGFGGTELPRNITSVDDIAYFYLDLLDELDLKGVILVGCSFGAWIALELATKSESRLAQMVLVGSVGVKFGGRDRRDITDIFSLTDGDLSAHLRVQPQEKPDYASMTPEEVTRIARNRESLALFGWSPTLFNPKLRGRLHRVRIPTQLLWGDQDRIVSVDYGRALAAELRGSELEIIPNAGHYAYLDQPLRFSNALIRFADHATPRVDVGPQGHAVGRVS